MNIFLTGASGTGKTTTGRLLAEHYGLTLQPSLSRTSPHEIGSKKHQEYIAEKLFDLATKDRDSVFDRTPLDVVGYDLAYGYVSQAINSMTLATVWKNECKPTIIYFPVYWQPEDDGVRPVDKRTTTLVDVTIKTQLQDVPHFVVDNESPEARLKSIANYIDNLRRNDANLRVSR